MCTLLVAFQSVDGAPLLVAANRDERLDREAAPPRMWPGNLERGETAFLAPVDKVAGGTWLGLNVRGLFVGVTNRFGVPRDDARESRGQLVVEALRAPDAAALHAKLAELSPTRFNAFHLLYADRTHAFVTWSDGTRITQETLAPGVHVVTERSLGASDAGRTELVLEAWRRLPVRPSLADLGALTRIHSQGSTSPLRGTCIHVPELGYGTRSSALLSVEAPPRESRFMWAEGSPCAVPHLAIDVGAAFDTLLA